VVDTICPKVEKPGPSTIIGRSKMTILCRNYVLVIKLFMLIIYYPAKCIKPFGFCTIYYDYVILSPEET
jgi:hypothetical protein